MDSTTPGDAEFALVLAFDTDAPEFVRGFEAGTIHKALSTADPNVTALGWTIHTSNLEMALRIGAATGFSMEVPGEQYPALDEWTHVEFVRNETEESEAVEGDE